MYFRESKESSCFSKISKLKRRKLAIRYSFQKLQETKLAYEESFYNDIAASKALKSSVGCLENCIKTKNILLKGKAFSYILQTAFTRKVSLIHESQDCTLRSNGSNSKYDNQIPNHDDPESSNPSSLKR